VTAPSGAGPVDTAEKALAAVVAEHPEFADHPLRIAPSRPGASPSPIVGGEPMIGLSAWAIVSAAPDGYLVTFVTGSGDCPAGCTEHRLDTYHVRTDGTVSHRCSTDPAAGVPPSDRAVPFDPCSAGDR
jgi:hypothetical protein